MSSSKPIFGNYSETNITSILLFFLVPAFIFMFGSIIGEDHEVVVDYLSRPGPAIITSLTIVIGLQHFQAGAQVLICLLYTSPSPRDATLSRMPSSA